jgi:hypothetical protein
MRPTKRTIAWATGAAWLALACASPIRTEHDASPSADFSRYATFAWIGESPLAPTAEGSGSGGEPRRVDEGMIQRAVEGELEARGYRPAPADAADLLVAFQVGSEQKVVEQPVAARATVYTAGNSPGSWYRSAPVRTRTYTQGTLSLEFFARSTHEAVWVGWASKRITGSDEPGPLIHAAVQRILADFPPAATPGPPGRPAPPPPDRRSY